MKEHRTATYALLALFGLIISLTVGANAWKSNLKVKRLLVEGNRIVETNEILQLAQIRKGTRMYDIDLMVMQRDIASHPFIKEVLVERDLPATLRISVAERTPLAIINTTGMHYIDQEGVVLPPSISKEVYDLPLLTGSLPPDLPVGRPVQNADVQHALAILSAAKVVNKELYHLISEVRLRNGGDLVLYASEEGVPIIFGRDHIAEKLAKLEVFWRDVVRERGPQRLQYVDLRFADQIVARWKTERG
jgi:cell division protein FtsQ